MNITVFGATGNVGRLVTHEALARGHHVTAYQRRQEPTEQHPNLHVVQGDIHDAAAVAQAIAGADAVISALGSWGTPDKDILSAGMRNIIPGMQAHGVRRIISLSGADARAAGDELSLIHRITHAVFGMIAGKVLRDAEEHIHLLEISNLDWTIARSPAMSNMGNAEKYALSEKRPMPWATINRHAVSLCLLHLAESGEYPAKAPYIIRK